MSLIKRIWTLPPAHRHQNSQKQVSCSVFLSTQIFFKLESVTLLPFFRKMGTCLLVVSASKS